MDIVKAFAGISSNRLRMGPGRLFIIPITAANRGPFSHLTLTLFGRHYERFLATAIILLQVRCRYQNPTLVSCIAQLP